MNRKTVSKILIVSAFLALLLIISGCNINITINDNGESSHINGEKTDDGLNIKIKNNESNDNEAFEQPQENSENEEENTLPVSSEIDVSDELFETDFCGDHFCSDNENSENCCIDCGCEAGKTCNNNTCQVLLAPIKINLEYSGPNAEDAEPLIDKLSTKDFLVVTLTKVEKISDRKLDHNDIEEFGLYSFGLVGGDKVYFKFPIKGTYNKRYKKPGYYNYLFNIDEDLFGPTSRVPIFSKSWDSLENRDVKIRLIVAEIDKPLVNAKLTYLDDPNELAEIIYDGNDVVFDREITLKANQGYNLGEYTLQTNDIRIQYKVEKLKGLTGVAKYRVQLKDGTLFKEVDNDGSNEVVTYARAATDFAWNDFGLDAKYDYLQWATSTYVNTRKGESVYNDFLPIVRESESSLEGPFLYIESDFIDLDDKCKGPDYGTKWRCLYSKKFNMIDINKVFYTTEELVKMYEEDKKEIHHNFINNFISNDIAIDLYDIH